MHPSLSQKGLDFAHAIRTAWAPLCNGHHTALCQAVPNCGSALMLCLLQRETLPNSAALSERGLLADNKHTLNSHRHWHNWKITPLGSYILRDCFNYKPYILRILTEYPTYRGSWEVNVTAEPRQKEKKIIFILVSHLCYSARTLKWRDFMARRNR